MVNFILYCTLFTLYCTVLCYSPVTTITIKIGNSYITPKRLPIWCSGNRNPLTMQEMQETWVQSLGGEDLLEKEMATHSSTLAWEISRTEESGGL